MEEGRFKGGREVHPSPIFEDARFFSMSYPFALNIIIM